MQTWDLFQLAIKKKPEEREDNLDSETKNESVGNSDLEMKNTMLDTDSTVIKEIPNTANSEQVKEGKNKKAKNKKSKENRGEPIKQVDNAICVESNQGVFMFAGTTDARKQVENKVRNDGVENTKRPRKRKENGEMEKNTFKRGKYEESANDQNSLPTAIKANNFNWESAITDILTGNAAKNASGGIKLKKLKKKLSKR